MSYTSLIMLTLAPMGSGLLFFFLPRLTQKIMNQIAAFGGSYLFGFLLLHLLPHLFVEGQSIAHELGFALLVGFSFQILLDLVSHGAAHGHSHQIEGTVSQSGNQSLLLFALCLHALVEGLLLGLQQGDFRLGTAILLHKLPAAVTLTLAMGKEQKMKTLLGLFLFSLATPLGSNLGGHLQGATWFPIKLVHLLNGFAAGNLLHIATTMLLEADPNHEFNGLKAFLMATGVVVALMTLHHH